MCPAGEKNRYYWILSLKTDRFNRYRVYNTPDHVRNDWYRHGWQIGRSVCREKLQFVSNSCQSAFEKRFPTRLFLRPESCDPGCFYLLDCCGKLLEMEAALILRVSGFYRATADRSLMLLRVVVSVWRNVGVGGRGWGGGSRGEFTRCVWLADVSKLLLQSRSQPFLHAVVI